MGVYTSMVLIIDTGYIFPFIIILEMLLDFTSPLTRACIAHQTGVAKLLILHHISSCFLLWGWLFNQSWILLAHVLVVIATFIYWKLNLNRCDWTIYVNRLCHWPEDKPLHDLLDMIGLKSTYMWNEVGHYLVIALGAVISAWKLQSHP